MKTELLGKEQILAAPDFQTADVPVPEWGGKVRVKSLTGEERDAYEATIVTQTKGGRSKVNLQNARAKLVVRTVVDEKGNLIFSDRDIKQLGAKSALALNRVYEKAAELSGLSDEDLDEMLENSEAIQTGSSTSDSPES